MAGGMPRRAERKVHPLVEQKLQQPLIQQAQGFPQPLDLTLAVDEGDGDLSLIFRPGISFVQGSQCARGIGVEAQRLRYIGRSLYLVSLSDNFNSFSIYKIENLIKFKCYCILILN